jgi:UDP-2,4-diacetamido-2,4,6-trideoxy-beta-L-altropyranose hydrolase
MLVIAIRVDSSYEIGIGHVMRCLTLANEIQIKKNATIFFVSRKADGNYSEKIKHAGFEYIELESGSDTSASYLNHGNWLRASQESDSEDFKAALNRNGIFNVDLIIVDHYGIDHLWHGLMRSFTKKIFVIDDLGDRRHDCDYLLDQTYSCSFDKYKLLVSKNCKQFLGTNYALLRSEFEGLQEFMPKERSVLVMFGGTDPDNLTLQTLKIIEKMLFLDNVNVVLNKTAKNLSDVKKYCEARVFFHLHISPKNIAQLMSKSLLSIGAAGTTSWERCAAGLPAVVVIQAHNQREIASNLKKTGVITFIEAENISTELSDQVNKWLKVLSKENNFSKKCLDVCDGYGTHRVVEEMFNDQ